MKVIQDFSQIFNINIALNLIYYHANFCAQRTWVMILFCLCLEVPVFIGWKKDMVNDVVCARYCCYIAFSFLICRLCTVQYCPLKMSDDLMMVCAALFPLTLVALFLSLLPSHAHELIFVPLQCSHLPSMNSHFLPMVLCMEYSFHTWKREHGCNN